jgi:glycosyltransferase involved in cell wall biosynthesis
MARDPARPAVGLLPALGGGLGALAETGQHSRLIDGYLRPYAAAFGTLYYFSYLPESLAQFTDAPEVLERARLLAPARAIPRGRRAVSMVRAHRAEFAACRVLRVFQLTGVIPALVARARLGVPYVTTYGFWYARLSRSPGRRALKAVLERVGLRRASAVIATTPALAAHARRHARRVELIPNGVDTRRFTPGTRAARARPLRPRVLYVGRLSPEKNLETVLAATERSATRPELVMVGPGPQRASLEALARRLDVAVDFRGMVDQTALPAIYAEADAFVLASFTEGHPKVLLEAMSAGLPCVVADNEGTRSLVTPGTTGLVFDASRPDELAACLDRVLGDAGLARRLGEAARTEVVARYDLAALVAREIALLRDVVGSREA